MTYGRGALECTATVVTKCRAILTNPRVLDLYDDDTAVKYNTNSNEDTSNDLYCADEVTEFSYGGCHHTCKSCVEAYDRRGVTRGPQYNSANGGAYNYGDEEKCYDCHDGYYLNPLTAKDYGQMYVRVHHDGSTGDMINIKHMGTCKPCGENVVNCLGGDIGNGITATSF